jgi:crotonobetainyl-CoA:carnitine CoA-transferase CaiB-like acyl-CoA transferase
LLGEHTREILAQHGYSRDEVERFLTEGIVVAENP